MESLASRTSFAALQLRFAQNDIGNGTPRSRRICDTCGSTLEAEMPSGFCPGCLLNTVLETETETQRAWKSHRRIRAAQ